MSCCNICYCNLKPFINIKKLLNFDYCSNCFHIISNSYTSNNFSQYEINEQFRNIINQLTSLSPNSNSFYNVNTGENSTSIIKLLFIYVKYKPNIKFELPNNIHIDYIELGTNKLENCDMKYDVICCLYMNYILDPHYLLEKCMSLGSIHTIYYLTTKHATSIFNYKYYNLSENDKCIYSSNSMQVLSKKYGLFINYIKKITINKCDHIIYRLSIFELVDSNLIEYLLQEIENNLYDETIYDEYQLYFQFYKNTLQNTLIKYKIDNYNIILSNEVNGLPSSNIIKLVKLCELSNFLLFENINYSSNFGNQSNNFLIISIESISHNDLLYKYRNNERLIVFILNPLRLELVTDFMNLEIR